MYATKVTRETLEAAVQAVGVTAEIEARGPGFRVKLFPLVTNDMRTPSGRRRKRNGVTVAARYQRTSPSYFNRGRYVHAVCWHGFRDFFRAVYAHEPDATFRTAFATYRGSTDFESKFEATGERNIGPPIAPVRARDACVCGPETQFGTLQQDGMLTNVRCIKQSDIAACPHFILILSHYRENGTCKCNDPAERVRMITEWGYTEADFPNAIGT